MEGALVALNDKLNEITQNALATNVKLDKMMTMMMNATAQQGDGKLGQSKGHTGTIHGKTRRTSTRDRSRSGGSDAVSDEST